MSEISKNPNEIIAQIAPTLGIQYPKKSRDSVPSILQEGHIVTVLLRLRLIQSPIRPSGTIGIGNHVPSYQKMN